MSVEEIEKAISELPPDKFAKLSEWFEVFSASRPYSATAEELRGIDRGLRDSAEGKFASAADVEAVFAKHRR
ncbi:MAG TPA: hypothetical protein VMS78_02070 [Rhizomicrobium sp.]|nr:hypothetical protein [Rhizomicrobium sp.]